MFDHKRLLGTASAVPLASRLRRFTGYGKNVLFCHSERSEESLFDLSVREEMRRDSTLRSE